MRVLLYTVKKEEVFGGNRYKFAKREIFPHIGTANLGQFSSQLLRLFFPCTVASHPIPSKFPCIEKKTPPIFSYSVPLPSS